MTLVLYVAAETLPLDGPVLEAVVPAQQQREQVQAAKALDPVDGAPLAQLKVGPEPSKDASATPEGRLQIDFASWRDQYLNNNVSKRVADKTVTSWRVVTCPWRGVTEDYLPCL